MYRQQQQKMAATDGDQQVALESQFVTRVGQLPIVTSTMGHLFSIYQSTKDSNNILKYTLETAETGVKSVVTTTLPLVATPVNKLDGIACDGLDKLEQKYPIINKPTEQWVAGGKSLYDANVKPSVDRVVAVKDYGVDTVTGVKQYGVDKINDVKQLGVNTVTSVTSYGTGKVQGAVTSVTTYGTEKVHGAMQTPYGRQVSSGLNRVLDITESYIDYYLPEEKPAGEATENTEAEKSTTEETEEMETSTEKDASLMRIVTVSDKARRRMYGRAIRELKSVQLRTRESLEHFNFTVDLIQYAKTNMGGVQAKVVAVPSKLKSVWDEINMDDEQMEAQQLSTEDKSDITTTTFERRAIATARHMTLRLKGGVGSLSASVAILPASLRGRVGDIRTSTEELYNSFATAENFKDLPSRVLEQTQAKAAYIQETLDFLVDYLQATRIGSWMKLNLATTNNAEEIEMEPVINFREGKRTDEITANGVAGEEAEMQTEQSPSETPPEMSPVEQHVSSDGEPSLEEVAEDVSNIQDGYNTVMQVTSEESVNTSGES